MPSVTTIKKRLKSIADPKRAKNLQRFFKTGPGEYGEGDKFLGITMPQLRRLSKEFRDISLDQVKDLLQWEFHEGRMLALLILVLQFKKGGPAEQQAIYQLYLASTDRINNWDFVDVTCPHIVGAWLTSRSRRPLYKLAKSTSVWEKRISIISTFAFIKHDDFDDALALAGLLLHDDHDLIHKAVGWVLREVGNRDRDTEEDFLRRHYPTMPRTMLRYAIEKFPEDLRQDYLKGRV